MVKLFALLALLVAATAHAGYNREVGVVALPDASFTAGQLMRATSADDATFSGGAEDRVMVGSGATWVDTNIPLCNPLASPPTFLTYNTTSNQFFCASGMVPGSAMQVLTSSGAGGFVANTHLTFDDATNELQVGDTVTPGTIQFKMDASTFGFGQMQGRGGGSYVRFYPNRNVGIASESLFFGIDSQNNSDGSANTNGVFITSDNSDAGVGNLRYVFREDGRMIFYSPTNNGIAISLQTPNLGLFDGQAYTLPTAKPAVDRYCLGSTIAGVWSWVDCALLGGRSGGQTLYGGTATTQKLTLGGNAVDVAGSPNTYIGIQHELRMWPDGVTGTGAATFTQMGWTSTWTPGDVNSFPRVIYPQGTFNYTRAPTLGLGPLFFYYQATTQAATNLTLLTPAAVFVNQGTLTTLTGKTTTLDAENAGGYGAFDDRQIITRAGTGAYDASASYIGFRIAGAVNGGTVNRWNQMILKDVSGGGTLNKQRGIVIENKAKCTAPDCVGLSNASTTDYPSGTQNIGAVGTAITGCQTRTTVGITNTTAAKLTLTATPTIASGNDGQVCRIMNVEGTAGAGAQIALQDETALANSNLRVSAAAACNLCALGICTLDARDFVEFTFSSTLGDWIMTGCQDN